MCPSTLLRAASIVTLILALGHTAGMPWTPERSARGIALVAEMRSHRFEVMSFSRTYFDFYLGFGLSISVILVCLAFLLWQLGAMANADAAMLRPSVFALALMFVALSVLDCICFFLAPLLLTLPVVVCLVWAWSSLRDSPA